MTPPRNISVVYDYQTFCLQAFGGISRYFCELSERVDRMDGHRARIVAPLHFNAHLHESRAAKVALHLPVRSERATQACRVVSRALSPSIYRWIGPDVVHRTFFRPLPRPKGARVVLTVFDMIHELFSADFGENDEVRRNKKRCVDDADHIVCISQSTANDLMRLFNVPADKISITYLGYSSVFDRAPGAAATPPPHRPFILYVGHRGGYKNHGRLLRAYAASSRLKAAFDLRLFGGPPLSPAERDEARSLGVADDRLHHHGGSDQVLAALFRQARLFVYPSEYEGFGIPPLEAMASGCPVACSNTSSIPEVVGAAAALFDPSDVDAIREAVERVCFDEVERSRLVEAGTMQARQFSWERCAADTTAVYQRVLADHT